MKDVRIGCSGWSYAHWRGVVYPEGLEQRRWLEHYSTLFDTVELNATFYRLPRRTTWPRGGAQPARLRLRREGQPVSHPRAPAEPTSAGASTASTPASSRCSTRRRWAPVLWQLPETFRRDDERLAATLERVFSRTALLRVQAPELVRSPRSTSPAGARRSARHRRPSRAALPGARADGGVDVHPLPLRQPRAAGNYSDRELDTWAGRIARWRRRVDVYAYFNNDWEGFAVRNAPALRERLSSPS